MMVSKSEMGIPMLGSVLGSLVLLWVLVYAWPTLLRLERPIKGEDGLIGELKGGDLARLSGPRIATALELGRDYRRILFRMNRWLLIFVAVTSGNLCFVGLHAVRALRKAVPERPPDHPV